MMYFSHIETVMASDVFSKAASLTPGDTWMIPIVGPMASLHHRFTIKT